MDSIKVGNRIEISLKRDKNISKTLVSQVENILGDRQLLVHVPISYGQLVNLVPKADYSFLFFTDKGMIRFDTSILKQIKEDGYHFLVIKLVSDGEKIQRREFFRFSCLLPIKFSQVKDDELSEESAHLDIDFEGIIKDVGGGGVRFVSNEEVPENCKVKCIIMLNDDYLIGIGTVLHRQFFPKSNYKYQYRVVFLGILPSEQEKIVQFIFDEQRKNVQKVRIKED